MRALHGGRGFGQPQAACRQQAERQGQRFVVGEHHGRQLETGDQAVAAIAATLRHHRNPQVFELGDVTAQGAAVHLQPPRQLGAAEAAMGLQQLQYREHARGGGIHGKKSSR